MGMGIGWRWRRSWLKWRYALWLGSRAGLPVEALA